MQALFEATQTQVGLNIGGSRTASGYLSRPLP
jgi:hypothetical protein